MARRIARGLFRLWVVGSVMWICTVGTVTWWTWPSDFDPDAYLSTKSVPDWARDPSPTNVAPKKPDDELPDAPWVKPAKPPTIQTAAEIALIPPILVLALGVGLGWAFKGFRD
jgi:hypothetical protein